MGSVGVERKRAYAVKSRQRSWCRALGRSRHQPLGRHAVPPDCYGRAEATCEGIELFQDSFRNGESVVCHCGKNPFDLSWPDLGAGSRTTFHKRMMMQEEDAPLPGSQHRRWGSRLLAGDDPARGRPHGTIAILLASPHATLSQRRQNARAQHVVHRRRRRCGTRRAQGSNGIDAPRRGSESQRAAVWLPGNAGSFIKS